LHDGTVTLSDYHALLSVGHDEYWSFEMRAHLENAIAAGVSVGFFGANPIYWQVRFERDLGVAKNRNMICHKYIPNLIGQTGTDASGTPTTGPCVASNGLVLCIPPVPVGMDPWAFEVSEYKQLRITARWRDNVLGRPEQNIVGQMYQDY